MELKKKVYTVTEIVESCGFSRVYVNRMLNTGELRGFKTGRIWRVKAEDLEAFMESKMVRKQG